MRHLALLLLTAVLAPAAPAVQNQPEVEVLKFGWRKLPKNFPSARKLQEMRDADIDARIREESQQPKPDYSEIKALEAEKQKQMTPPDIPKGSDKAYEYKFRFKNKSTREVASLKWAYVFKDAATGQGLLRYSFEGQARISPGKEKEVTAYTDSGPPKVASAGALKKGGRAWDEFVTIEAVEYSDGSRWEKR